MVHKVNIDRLKQFFRGKLINEIDRKSKVGATAKLQAYVETARRAKQLQEECEAEDLKPEEDGWGLPIVEVKESSPQKSPHGAKIEDLSFLASRLLTTMCARSSAG